MREQSNRCSLCMTKMRSINGVLVCPECGNHTSCYVHEGVHEHYDAKGAHTHVTETRTAKGTPTNTKSAQGKVSPTNAKSAQGKASPAKRIPRILFIIIITFASSIYSASSYRISSLQGIIRNLESFFSDAVEAPSSEEANTFADLPHSKAFKQMLSQAFDKEYSQITSADLESVFYLDLYPYGPNLTSIEYILKDGTTDIVDTSFDDLDTSDFKYFTNLEYLYADYLHFNPSDLNALHNLHTLFSSNTPQELAEMIPPSNLQYLGVHLLSPDATLDELTQFYNLTYLYLYAEEVEDLDISCLQEMTTLESLCISDQKNCISNLSPLNTLNNLTYLSLDVPGMSDLTFLANMPQLQTLSLLHCGVEDLSPLSYVSNVTDFTITDCDAKDWSYLENLTKLQALELYTCNADASLATALETLTELQDLYMDETYIDGNLVCLLDLDSPKVTDQNLLVKLPALEYALCITKEDLDE